MDRLLKHEESGKFIAQWDCALDACELREIRRMTLDALARHGIDATANFAPIKKDSAYMFGGRAWHWLDIRINNAPSAVRIWNGSVIKGLSVIHLCVRRRSGFLTYEGAMQWQKKAQGVWDSDKPLKEKYAALDAMQFDAQSLDMNITTNGVQRAYRGRTWWKYEGRGHYHYGDWSDIEGGIYEYLRNIAYDLRLDTKGNYQKVA